MENAKTGSSVQIGNVGESITGSQIAGRDIVESTATASRAKVDDENKPSVDDLADLLKGIKSELAALSAHTDALAAVSASTPSRLQGAAATVEAVIPKVNVHASSEDKESMLREITDATSSIAKIAENATQSLKSTAQIAHAAGPLISLLSPLHEHLVQAISWIGQIWP